MGNASLEVFFIQPNPILRENIFEEKLLAACKAMVQKTSWTLWRVNTSRKLFGCLEGKYLENEVAKCFYNLAVSNVDSSH